MKTKRVRPVLVEIKFNSIEEMQGDIIMRDNKLYTHATLPSLKKQSNDKVFELIIISLEDEKIEEGDEFVHYWFNENSTNKDRIVISTADKNTNDKKHHKSFIGKVITRQSQISPEYISKFIEQYNNDYIEDLETETEELYIYPDGTKSKISRLMPDAKPIEEPKLTNGFVTIVEKEVISYTEEEVLDLIFKYSNDLLNRTDPFLDTFENESATNFTKEWFNQNKKK